MRKTWELYLSLILQFRPSHCLSVEDKQRRAHADMYSNIRTYSLIGTNEVHTHPWTSTVASS